MRWAIDGYNLIFAVPVEGAKLEAQRDEMLTKLRRIPDAMTVFFDASKAPGLTAEVPGRGRLEIVYVREGSADDAIVNWIRSETLPNEITVVTNDRELAARVKALHAKTMGAKEFLKKVDPERLEGSEKPRITKDEARRWAEEFGVNPDEMI